MFKPTLNEPTAKQPRLNPNLLPREINYLNSNEMPTQEVLMATQLTNTFMQELEQRFENPIEAVRAATRIAAVSKEAIHRIAEQLEDGLHTMTTAGYDTRVLIVSELYSDVQVFALGATKRLREATVQLIESQIEATKTDGSGYSFSGEVLAEIGGSEKTVMLINEC